MSQMLPPGGTPPIYAGGQQPNQWLNWLQGQFQGQGAPAGGMDWLQRLRRNRYGGMYGAGYGPQGGPQPQQPQGLPTGQVPAFRLQPPADAHIAAPVSGGGFPGATGTGASWLSAYLNNGQG